jgi:hypothetical protein
MFIWELQLGVISIDYINILDSFKNGIQILMVKKSTTYHFCEFVAGHYKKLLPYGNLKRYKFYIVGGPSMDTRLSKASLDNQVTDAYRKIFLKADLGLEFSNISLYTLFFNYQQNVGSITKTPIKTNLNSFQLGIIIKAKKLL